MIESLREKKMKRIEMTSEGKKIGGKIRREKKKGRGEKAEEKRNRKGERAENGTAENRE